MGENSSLAKSTGNDKDKSLITLDFCYWLFNNFDELVDEYKDFGRILTVKEWRARQEAEEILF